MYLTRHHTEQGSRWAVDGRFLPDTFDLRLLLELRAETVREFLNSSLTNEKALGVLLAPLEAGHEVWGSQSISNLPETSFSGERPVLYFKASGWRVVGHHEPIRIRDDSAWNVPEPMLTLIVKDRKSVV